MSRLAEHHTPSNKLQAKEPFSPQKSRTCKQGVSLETIQEELHQLYHWSPTEAYSYLFAWAQDLEPYPTEQRLDHNKVPFCNAEVYVTTTEKKGELAIWATASSMAIKGVLAIFVQLLDGVPVAQSRNVLPSLRQFVQDLPFSVSPNRNQALKNFLLLIEKHLNRLL